MAELRSVVRRAALVLACSGASALAVTGCFGRSDLEDSGMLLPDGGFVVDGAGGQGAGTGGRSVGSGGQALGTGGQVQGRGGQFFGSGGQFFGSGGQFFGSGGQFFGSGGQFFGTGGQFIGSGGQFIGSGGQFNTGGTIFGTGGRFNTGGFIGGDGGRPATGGLTASGGTVSTGGVTGAGGFTPVCNATTCSAGCCDASGQCAQGRSDDACGVSGQSCADCNASGNHCAPAGFCYAGAHCGPDTCAGCCTPNGQCRAGTGPRNCGVYGAVCENCNSQIGETCQAGACAAPGATCPAAYGGCIPGAMTQPPASSRSCATGELSGVASACAGTGTSAGCTAALGALARSNAACFGCLGQFMNDGAVVKCLAPFLSASCNESLTCATDCSTGSCGQCLASGKQACQTAAFAAGGPCNPYLGGYFCAAAAFGSTGAFCDAERIGDTGAFLRGVGAYYCSK